MEDLRYAGVQFVPTRLDTVPGALVVTLEPALSSVSAVANPIRRSRTIEQPRAMLLLLLLFLAAGRSGIVRFDDFRGVP
jgi:hypothetical protein